MSAPKCQAQMHGGRECGRSRDGGAEVCVCHRENPIKDEAAFNGEMAAMLEGGDYDFTGFVFPKALDFESHTFSGPAYFDNATFWGPAKFGGAKFECPASFVKAVFRAGADFREAVLAGKVYADGATFMGRADFSSATFEQEATFTEVTFRTDACFLVATFQADVHFEQTRFSERSGATVFLGTTFQGKGVFSRADFAQPANFEGAGFQRDADFTKTKFQGRAILSARFEGDAAFSHAAFGSEARFTGATFQGSAGFYAASFDGVALFQGATFQGEALFPLAIFKRWADFSAATFEASAGFIHTGFHSEVSFFLTNFRQEAYFADAIFGSAVGFVGGKRNVDEQGVRVDVIDNRVFSRDAEALFSSAIFKQPTDVVFHHVFLGKVRFLGTDVRQLDFTDVDWTTRSSGHFAVWDELGTKDDDRDHELIAKLYRQLKHNYEERRDHITAGDFHIGEMEMRRLAHPHKNRVRRFVERNFSFLALYKRLSGYGENYKLALLWIVVVICVFTALASLPALAIQTSDDAATPQAVYAFWPRVLYSTMCFLLRGDKPFEPMTLAGHYAAVVEGILGPPLIAMFVLALNRRFKR